LVGRVGGGGRLEAFGVGEGAAEEEFDLGVEAAEVVVGPFLDGVQGGGVDAEEEGFAVHSGEVFGVG
jgi:hypothetical protein